MKEEKEVRIDSRILAKRLGISHKELMILIELNKAELEKLGELVFLQDDKPIQDDREQE